MLLLVLNEPKALQHCVYMQQLLVKFSDIEKNKNGTVNTYVLTTYVPWWLTFCHIRHLSTYRMIWMYIYSWVLFCWAIKVTDMALYV